MCKVRIIHDSNQLCWLKLRIRFAELIHDLQSESLGITSLLLWLQVKVLDVQVHEDKFERFEKLEEFLGLGLSEDNVDEDEQLNLLEVKDSASAHNVLEFVLKDADLKSSISKSNALIHTSHMNFVELDRDQYFVS